jgi:dethiobiotin synthase
MQGFFVTATDTNSGKTIVTTALVKWLRLKGIDAVPFKPVQTGGTDDTDFVFANNNGLSLLKEDCFSYFFDKPCSPHLASAIDGTNISINKIIDDFNQLRKHYESVIVEGAGGIMVPLGDGKFILDVIIKLRLPVILVIANKLGAINHALLSIEKLKTVGLVPEVLVFNELAVAEEEILLDNIKTISEASGIEKVYRIPYMSEVNLDKVVNIFEKGEKFWI